MIVTKSGITIRMAVKENSVMFRATQGVTLIRLDKGDEIGAVAEIFLLKDNGNGENGDDKEEGNKQGELEI